MDYGRFANPMQQTGMPWGEGYVIIPTFDWKQIGGDMDAAAHGGTIARADGHSIELFQIMPVREYVGDGEAAEVGFPFWSKEASFSASDLDPNDRIVRDAMKYAGFSKSDLADMTPEVRAIAIAEALLESGSAAGEGPAGYSDDLPNYNVVWSWGGRQKMREYLADEDEEFRREVLGEGEEE